MLVTRRKKMIEAVRSHALKNYERGGWDYVVECYDDQRIRDILNDASCTTVDQAIDAVGIVVARYPNHPKTRVICVSDWTSLPGARYGLFSGEQYREDILRNEFRLAVHAGETLTVNLDAVMGYSSSFLEEAFGGLARDYGIAEVLAVVKVVCCDEPSVCAEVAGYITNANKRNR